MELSPRRAPGTGICGFGFVNRQPHASEAGVTDMSTSDDTRGLEEPSQAYEAGSQGLGQDLSHTLAGEADSSEYIGEPPPGRSRAPILLLLLVVVLGGVAYFMYFKRVPQEATAAVQDSSTQVARHTIDQFLTSGDDNIKQMEQLLQNTEKVVQQFRRYPSITQVPLSELKDNPFLYATAVADTSSDDSEAVLQRRRAEERQRVQRAVQQLQLQSIMHSDTSRACMINNSLYTEGQQIEQFTIDRITPEAVVVRSGPYKFELRMVH
jgi:hypothetical protein